MCLLSHTLAVTVAPALRADEADAVAAFKALTATFRTDITVKGEPVFEVRLSAEKTGQDGIRHLKELPHLRRKELQNTPVSEASVKLLADPPRLERLGLYGTGLTPSGLKELTRLKTLKSLDIGFADVRDDSSRSSKRGRTWRSGAPATARGLPPRRTSTSPASKSSRRST